MSFNQWPEAAIDRILRKAREYYRSHGQISDEEWKAYEKLLKLPDYRFAELLVII
jgi:hypothetical protein